MNCQDVLSGTHRTLLLEAENVPLKMWSIVILLEPLEERKLVPEYERADMTPIPAATIRRIHNDHIRNLIEAGRYIIIYSIT